MKKRKQYLFIGIIAMSLLLGGCGTSLHELTAEEEELIIHYAAYAVAKHNIQQKDGMSGVYIPEETEEESETETESESESEGNTDGEETQKPDDNSISLAELIGHGKDLKVSYTESYVADNYVEGDAYSVDAGAGNRFYVMKFKLTNTTEQDVKVDNAAINPIFKLVTDGLAVRSEVTFLTTDFSTYQGTIAAGESVETILLFEVSDSKVDSIKEPTLSITIDKVTKNVKL